MAGMNTTGITLLGLGPGGPEFLTRQAVDLLGQIPEIYLQTGSHPAVAAFPPTLVVHAVDELTSGKNSPGLVDAMLLLAHRPQGVVLGTPGHPLICNRLAGEVARRARLEGISVKVVGGLGFLEAVASVFGDTALEQASLAEASQLASLHTPPFPPHVPAVVSGLDSHELVNHIQIMLGHVYPPQHVVSWIAYEESSGLSARQIALANLADEFLPGSLACLLVPPLGPATSFEGFQEIAAHLRAPEGCPWDREQTHLSLRQSLLEETYEVLAALDAGDVGALQEELGDLLFQVMIHSQIANEFAEFRIADVIQGIHTKLVSRHPHVFGDTRVSSVDHVLQNWEKLKAAERAKKGKAEASLLDGVPKALPALAQAEQYQGRAARVGFEWPDLQQVFEKIQEEIHEVRQAASTDERAFEIGDLLFAAVNLARRLDVEPESALRQANQRFRQRFHYIETKTRQQERSMNDLTPADLLALWHEAKSSLL